MSDKGQSKPGEGSLSRAELKQAALVGARWVSLARVAAELMTVASSVVLARVISPAEFGRAAVAIIVISLAVSLFNDGFAAALVQLRAASNAEFAGTAALALTAGAILTLSFFFAAPLVTLPIFGERISYLIDLSASAFILAGAGCVPNGVLSRELNFRAISLIELASLVAGVATSLMLAVAVHLDGEALVLGALVATATSTILLMLTRPIVPRRVRGVFSTVIRFTSRSSMASMAYAVSRNVDYAILGARLGPAQVGFYWRAYQLGIEWQSKISGVMVRLAFPLYSRSAALEDIRKIRSRIVRLHAILLLPLLLTFIVVAPEFIPWLYGDRWTPTVLPAQILGIAGIAAALTTGSGPLLLAAGRSGLLLAWNLGHLAVFSTVVFVLAPKGLTTVCVGVAIYMVGVLAASQILLRVLFDLSLLEFWNDIRTAVLASIPLLLVSVSSSYGLDAVGAPTPLHVLLVCGLAAAAYTAIVRSRFPEAWADVVALIKGSTTAGAPLTRERAWAWLLRRPALDERGGVVEPGSEAVLGGAARKS